MFYGYVDLLYVYMCAYSHIVYSWPLTSCLRVMICELHVRWTENVNTNIQIQVKQFKRAKCRSRFTVFVGALENNAAWSLPELSNAEKQAKAILSLSGQLAESVSLCVETAPESPTNSLYALGKSHQTLHTRLCQMWKLPNSLMWSDDWNEFWIFI